jgi:para-nitrobenzyl esterase
VVAVSGGTFVQMPEVTVDSYRSAIASVLGVSDSRAAEIAAEYPLSAYASPTLALSALVGDANFAATSFRVGTWTSRRVLLWPSHRRRSSRSPVNWSARPVPAGWR